MSAAPVPRVAIIGSGPSGLYTAAALLAPGHAVAVDVIDRLPTPYGLVRYGVAPDHARMKSVTRVLARPFDQQHVRFLGNVEFGADLDATDLARHYHATVHASGTEHDRQVGVPGEHLPGCLGATDLVRWYNGHPDAAAREVALDAEQVAVVGAGNVALDVVRVLARTAKEMSGTDVPTRVLDALARSRVREIHMLVRRGPRGARFTPAELFQLGELADAHVIVHADEDMLRPAESDDKRVRQNLEVLGQLAAAPRRGRRRVHLRFLTTPVEILGSGRVEGVRVENTSLDGGPGRSEVVPARLVVTAVGFRGVRTPGLPFDEATGTVPNRGGRVIDDGIVRPGTYVTGWIKRGPTGIIGSNKPDGAETAAAVWADLPGLVAARPEPLPDVAPVLTSRGARVVNWTAWLRLDRHEAELGSPLGRGRVKVPDLSSMLAACGP